MSETKAEAFFDKAVFGGYDKTQVDEFVEEARKMLSWQKKENEVLKQKMQVLADALRTYQENGVPAVVPAADAAEPEQTEPADTAEAASEDAPAAAVPDISVEEAEARISDLLSQISKAQESLQALKVEKASFLAAMTSQYEVCLKQYESCITAMQSLPDVPEIPVGSVEVSAPIAPVVAAAPAEPVMASTEEEPQPEAAEEVKPVEEEDSDDIFKSVPAPAKTKGPSLIEEQTELQEPEAAEATREAVAAIADAIAENDLPAEPVVDDQPEEPSEQADEQAAEETPAESAAEETASAVDEPTEDISALFARRVGAAEAKAEPKAEEKPAEKDASESAPSIAETVPVGDSVYLQTDAEMANLSYEEALALVLRKNGIIHEQPVKTAEKPAEKQAEKPAAPAKTEKEVMEAETVKMPVAAIRKADSIDDQATKVMPKIGSQSNSQKQAAPAKETLKKSEKPAKKSSFFRSLKDNIRAFIDDDELNAEKDNLALFQNKKEEEPENALQFGKAYNVKKGR